MTVGGSTYDADGHRRAYLALLDTIDGSFIWEKEYDGTGHRALLFAAKECADASLIAAGGSFEDNSQHGLLLHTTAEGDSLWMRAYLYVDSLEVGSEGRFHDVLPTPDGGFIAAGYAYSTQNYSQDAWVVKVDSLGCIVPGCDGTGVTELVTNLKDALSIYPNPAHGQVSVQVDLPPSLRGKSGLQLSIVDAQGQVVAVHPVRDGVNEVPLAGLAAGLYHVHLTNGRAWYAGTQLVVE